MNKDKEHLCACTSPYLRDTISASNRVEMTPPCPPEVAAAVFAEALDIFRDPQDPNRLEIEVTAVALRFRLKWGFPNRLEICSRV
jgi:hypothetical protein